MPPESFGRADARLRAQVEDVHHLARAALGVRAVHAVVAAVEAQRLLDVEEAVEVDVLLREPDEAAGVERVVRVAEDARLALRDADQVADGGDQRRLARAVRAQQPEELARPDLQVDPVERQEAVVVALRQAGELEGGDHGPYV